MDVRVTSTVAGPVTSAVAFTAIVATSVTESARMDVDAVHHTPGSIRAERKHFDALEQMHAGQHRDAAAHVPLDELAAAGQHRATVSRVVAVPRRREPRDVARGIDERGAARHQFRGETGQQRIEAAGTARDVDVRIHCGRDAGAKFGQARQRLAIEQRHAIEMIREHTGGEQSRQTTANHETVRMTRSRHGRDGRVARAAHV